MKSSPKPCSTATAQFSAKARELGLYLRYVSLAGVELLARIESELLPMQIRSPGEMCKSPTGLGSVSAGPLINHHLLELREGFYRVTQKGSDYLKTLKKAGLL